MIDYLKLGIKLRNHHLEIIDSSKLATASFDDLVYAAVFGDTDTKLQTRWIIGEIARLRGINFASINALYRARGRGELADDFTVPALNLRGLAYDSARAIFAAMTKGKIGAVIFELAKSEMDYTAQSPEEYAIVIAAAAVREGYSGPIFLQADHTQLRAKAPGIAEDDEYLRLTHHIKKCIRAGFYNIDIDGSTLVNLREDNVAHQQASNIAWTAKLTRYIRDIQPIGLPICVGGEIGHIGDQNSTVEDFEVFVNGLNHQLGLYEGISKVSVQTGTSHGGVVNPDGTLASMHIDFDVLKNITLAAKKYAIGGSVQHGASTLPDEAFHQFPTALTLEIHLATGWQNLIFDHPSFPSAIKHKIYRFLLAKKKDNTLTDAQYLYKERKRAWGEFKQEIWDLDESIKTKLRLSLMSKAQTIFRLLNVEHTLDLVKKYAILSHRIKSIHDYQGD